MQSVYSHGMSKSHLLDFILRQINLGNALHPTSLTIFYLPELRHNNFSPIYFLTKSVSHFSFVPCVSHVTFNTSTAQERPTTEYKQTKVT